jgi:ribosome-associated heat shock protein Hsp15
MSEPTPRDGQRIDRWLWCARFFKSRTIAARLCAEGRVRLNRRLVGKASAVVRVEDVLTFPQAREIRVIRVAALADRRGPASEARLLYEDLAPSRPAVTVAEALGVRDAGSGRPTKRQRRALERLRGEAE